MERDTETRWSITNSEKVRKKYWETSWIIKKSEIIRKKYCFKLKCKKFVTAVLSTGSLLLLSRWQSVRDRAFETMKHTISFRVKTHIFIFEKMKYIKVFIKSGIGNHIFCWGTWNKFILELKIRSLVGEFEIKSNVWIESQIFNWKIWN